MRILLIILSAIGLNAFSQQSVYFCHPLFPYSNNELSDPGFIVDEKPCFVFHEDSIYNYPNGVNKDLRASLHHKIEPGFKMGSSPGNGTFTLQMLPAGVDVVLIEPSSLSSIPKYEKMELGIKIPQEIRDRIEDFRTDKNDPNGINPYLSWEFQITATFKTVLPSLPGAGPNIYEKDIDAFYYEEFERNILPYTGPPGVDDITYQTFGGTWNSVYTDYNFRVRFAPPAVGHWYCNIELKMPGYTLTYPEFEFDVIESNNPGYVHVGANKRFLKLGDQTYMPFGPNFPHPYTYPELNPQTAEDMGIPENYRPTMAPLQTYLDYEENLAMLADEGANHFRLILTPSTLDIEFEEIGNYNGRMHQAWELDNIVNTCDSLGLRIQFNLLIQYVLETNPFDIKHWDWAHHSAYNNADFSMVHGATDQGYCYHQNEYFSLAHPLEFFSSVEAKKYYKEKLRYIYSRWGYSTNIEMFELISEVNQVGNVSTGDPNTDIVGNYKDYDSLQLRISTQELIYSWNIEMANYIKSDLAHDWHILSASYSGNIGEFDQTFESDLFDVCAVNWYDDRTAFVDTVIDDTLRTLQVGASNLSYFQDLTNPYLDTGEYRYKDNRILMLEIYDKPIIFSETGPKNVEICDNGIALKSHLWLSAFSGIATGNDWNAWITPQYWSYYKNVIDFIDQSGLNFDEENFQPGHLLKTNNSDWASMESKSHLVEMTYLWNEDKTCAIGVIRNRSLNYNTFPNYPQNVYILDSDSTLNSCSGQPFYRNLVDSTELYFLEPWIYSDFLEVEYSGNFNGNNKLTIKGMSTGSYNVNYYDIEFPNAYFFQSSDNGPNIKIEYPILTYNRPMIGFIVQKNSKSQIMSNNNSPGNAQNSFTSSESINPENNFIYQIFPNPSEGVFSIQTNQTCLLSVYSLDGSLLMHTVKVNGILELDLSAYASGVYILRMDSENSNILHKLILQ